MAEEIGIKVAFDVLNPTNRDIYVDRAYFGYDGMLNILEIMGNDWERAYRSKEISWAQYE
jgi:nitrogenase molybdenum-iron protein alpha/beta subunit